MGNSTGKLDIGSQLIRNKWMREGMLQSKSKSFFDGLSGKTADAIIYQKNDLGKSEGNTVVFDFDGNLATAGFRGSEQAFGKGHAKFKFSDKLTIEDGRYTVDNGKKFDGVEIGDLSINEHTDSRTKLADNFVRAKDQMIFDAGVGFAYGSTPSHIVRPNDRATVGALTATDTMSWEFIVDLETIISEGRGYTESPTGIPIRRPLNPYQIKDGGSCWLMILNRGQIADLLKDTKFQTIYQNADVRGAQNALIKHGVARIGSLFIMETGLFFGSTVSNKLFKTAVEIAGLRTIDENGVFSGTTQSQSGIIANRGLLLGGGAFQVAFGKQPDYKYQESGDFAITSESALEVWMQVKKTELTAEVDDYEQAKVAGFDYGCAVFDTYRSGA